MTKIDVLQKCTVEGNIVKLPDVQLDRKLYLEVKKAIELIGGKWKGGKTWGFVFQTDPTDLLDSIANGKNVNLKKDFQFFATPKKIAEMLVDYANIENHDTVLDPSAGQGAIIQEINKQTNVCPDCFELMETNRIILKKSGLYFNLIGDDFLKSDDRKYTKIVANPPFSKNQDIDHVYKMWSKLARGGRLVTIMSRHWMDSNNKKETQFREFLEGVYADTILLDAGEFKESGTNILTVIVIIDKPL